MGGSAGDKLRGFIVKQCDIAGFKDILNTDHLVVARARPQGANEVHQGLIAGAFKYTGQHGFFRIQKTRWVLRIQGLLNLLKLFFQLFNAHAIALPDA